MADDEPRRNDRLRGRRLAAGWTEGQVAEQVRQRVEDVTDRAAALDADYVSKLERGLITWPNREYRDAFRAVFRAATDAELGFYCKRTRRDAAAYRGPVAPEEVDPTDRRQLLGLAAAAAVGATLEEPVERIIAAADMDATPTRVGLGDVRDIAAATATLEKWDHRAGGAPTRGMALGSLRWATALRRASTTPAVRAKLNAAVAHLADLAAWTTFDAGLPGPARRLFTIGLSCAREAGDQGVLTHVASGYARQEMYVGNVAGALELVRLARTSAGRLTPAARAMLEVVTAQAYARVPDPAACTRHLRRAEDHYADSAGGPPWIRYFTAAKLDGDVATALYDLGGGTTSDGSLADRLAAAADRYPVARRRSKAIATARLATVLYRQQAPDRAASAGTRALDLAAGVRSARLADDLRAMAAAAVRFPDDATARALRRRTGQVVGGPSGWSG